MSKKTAVSKEEKAFKQRAKQLLKDLKQYCTDIINDNPLSCQKHKWACARFLDDLKNSRKKKYPYKFDAERAQKFIDWMELFQHHQGVLAGQPFKAHIILKFVFGNIYGWVDKETGYRRFVKFYWQVARKNVKSMSLAMMGLYETMAFTKNETQEVYCAATKKEQAAIVYEEAKNLLRKSPAFMNDDIYNVSYNKIVHNKTGSFMRALSKEDKKTGDGLHPQAGVIDEYHAHETSEIYDILDSGMGFKAQPLIGIITTAGFDLSFPCYDVEYDLVSKLLNPAIEFTIDSYFVMINELEKNQEGDLADDIKNPAVWVKANPIICSYKEGRAYLEKKLAEALEAPEKMRNFLTKHMNLWVMMREAGYMHMGKWRKCKGGIPDLKDEYCFVGIDLASKGDLTSAGFEFKVNNKYYVISYAFMPEDTIAAKAKEEKVPYELWVEKGWIIPTPGAVTDYRFVKDFVLDTAKENGWFIEEWCADPWMSQQLASDLREIGHTIVDIVQGIKTLSEPTKDFRDEVYKGNVIHDGNPVLAWAMNNAVVDEVDRNKNIILNKKKSKQKIDNVAALINAHVRCRLKEGAVYNERGMRKL